ncbi:translation factor GTPase family protein [Streptosporangium roseum]|uniref:translation factor GTPase family protein n=1 Tax=Streptosporangium roseum TaxID=2001 RepID=UPI00331E5D9C
MSFLCADVLNLAIIAHVDAGKTSLTERLLFECGAISEIGSVDDGTTRTDSNEIERARGITIRSGVVSFQDGDRQYNLVDTPGHADFVAEVERALMAVDAVILVIAAPEGVQPQTRALHRVVARLRLPTVVFVNKIDSVGAAGFELMKELSAKLGLTPVAMGALANQGTREAEFTEIRDAGLRRHWAERLAEHDEVILEQFVGDRQPSDEQLLKALREQAGAGSVQPVVFGSSLTGAGIDALRSVLRQVLEPSPGSAELSARVFAIELDERREVTALVRCYGGSLADRQQVTVQRLDGTSFRARVRGLTVVAPRSDTRRNLTVGHIARLRGVPLGVGDRLGTGEIPARHGQFPAPALQVAVRPDDPLKAPALRAALLKLADQDPLLRAELGPDGESIVHLYGDVQQEVLQETLSQDFGLEARFDEPEIVHVERPVGVGSAVEMIGNGFLATVGLRVAPGVGFTYRREVELGAMPVSFHDAVEESAESALRQGRHGWRVIDIEVTLTHCGYWARPYSAAADFRDATPHVLMRALAGAETRVYEPMHRFWIELEEEYLGTVTRHLRRHEGEVEQYGQAVDLWLIEGRIPLRTLATVRRQLMSLTNGRMLLTSLADGDKEARREPPPMRPRTDGNPFDRDEYMRFLAHR